MLFSVVQWAHRAPAKCFTWPEVQWLPLRCPHRYLWVKNQKQESSTKDFYQHHQRFMLHWCDKKKLKFFCLFIITLSSLGCGWLIVLHITSLTSPETCGYGVWFSHVGTTSRRDTIVPQNGMPIGCPTAAFLWDHRKTLQHWQMSWIYTVYIDIY